MAPQPARAGRSGPRSPQSYPRVPAATAAAMAGDHGRKLHELPWLYLDSVGHEYGPVHGCTMHEWLMVGRFPVGSELRVRLPEWEQHLPLHQLYPDLSMAFVLPPAWPDMFGEVTSPQPGEAAASASGAQSSGGPVPSAMGPLAVPAASGGVVGSAVPFAPVQLVAASAPSIGPALAQSTPSVPSANFVLERLMQDEPRPLSDEPLLPKPPPQPSYSRLQELFSQPQEGPPTWEQ